MSLRKSSKTELRRASTVVHRRPTTRRSVARRSVPVDKLLFLRHRAKENMKFGVLFSSEAGFIHCWSLYGERHDMGMFYGPSKTGESILAMSTDKTNQHFICGDTRGEIRVYNIEKYCCSITSPIQFESSPPPLVNSWQAHLASIIYCEWIDYKGNGEFLLTGSTDHTTRLWTMNGEQIGIFGQRQAWDVELLITARREKDEEEAEEQQQQQQISEKSPMKIRESDRDSKSVNSEKHNQTVTFEITEGTEKRPGSSSTAPFSENSQIFKSNSFILDKAPLSLREHTGLGITIERGLTQQKLTRQERRHRFGGIDGRRLVKGGVCVTPYALLFTQDIEEAGANQNPRQSSARQRTFDDLIIPTKEDLLANNTASQKSRLILPPILPRQTTSSSFISNATTIPLESEINNKYSLPSRQNTFMKSISEIS